ncbi:hypothetical protein BCR34DRAFT_630954, partial [Clohesyomyces aquaticus]
MYRMSWSPQFVGKNISRIGSLDDITLQESALRPIIKQFVENRVAWLGVLEGA